MTDVAPGWPLVIEEVTENHCVATTRDLVMVFAYEGSASDVRHVETGARVIGHLSRRQKGKVRLLFMLPPAGGKPPSGAVRSAILSAHKGAVDRLSRGCVVMPGSGFSAAVHRAALTGITTLARWTMPHLITSDLREGLAYLLGPAEPVPATLLQFCVERSRGAPANGAR